MLKFLIKISNNIYIKLFSMWWYIAPNYFPNFLVWWLKLMVSDNIFISDGMMIDLFPKKNSIVIMAMLFFIIKSYRFVIMLILLLSGTSNHVLSSTFSNILVKVQTMLGHLLEQRMRMMKLKNHYSCMYVWLVLIWWDCRVLYFFRVLVFTMTMNMFDCYYFGGIIVFCVIF